VSALALHVRKLRASGLFGQGARWILATALSATLTMVTPMVLHEGLRVPQEVAVACGMAFVFFVNFFTVRTFVFCSRAPALRQLIQFGLSAAAFRIAEYGLFLALFQIAGLHYVVALFCALVVSFFSKFFVLRALIFKPS
jgi:putative flippase GtrA